MYWKRSREIIETGEIRPVSGDVMKSRRNESLRVISALTEWRATLRPEVVELKNWPTLEVENFRKKRLWQTRFFDHVIRNDSDLEENLRYIEMNSVREGYVAYPQFYPYTGFLE